MNKTPNENYILAHKSNIVGDNWIFSLFFFSPVFGCQECYIVGGVGGEDLAIEIGFLYPIKVRTCLT